ncbi:MarR family winged helix-turn-helix transcriptional regulator [Micromonospora sp. DT81.3]
MSEADDAARVAERIAAALAQLRGPRPPRGAGFGPGPGDFRGWGPHGGHMGGPHSHDPASHPRGHGHGGPWRGDMGPMGRFAARFRLLEALASASAPLSVSEIADRIGVDQPRASRLVQATVEAGHARRQADENDARRTNILITDEGRALIAQARGARVGAVEAALAGFTPEERAQLAALLARLAQAWPRDQ